MEKISLNLSNMKFMLYGDAENEPKEGDMNKLVEEVRKQQSGPAAPAVGVRCGQLFTCCPLIPPFPSVHRSFASLCSRQIFHTNLLLDLIDMKRFEFEARKDVAQVYNFVLRQKKAQAVEYVKQHPQILRALVDGYNDPEIALNAGSILREVRIDTRHARHFFLSLFSSLSAVPVSDGVSSS